MYCFLKKYFYLFEKRRVCAISHLLTHFPHAHKGVGLGQAEVRSPELVAWKRLSKSKYLDA